MSRWSSLRPTRSRSKCRRLRPACSPRSPSRMARRLRSARCLAPSRKAPAAPAKPRGQAASCAQAAPSAEARACASRRCRRAAGALGAQDRGRERHGCRDGAGHRQGRPRHQGRHARGDRARAPRADPGRATPAAAVQVRAPSPADDAAREERVRMTRLRQTIARRLKDAQNTAAMLTTFNEVDMGASDGAAQRSTRSCSRRSTASSSASWASSSSACVQALKEIPAVNAEIDGADIIYKNYYHIGIAVGTDKRSGGAGGARCDASRSPRSRRRSPISAAAPATAR